MAVEFTPPGFFSGPGQLQPVVRGFTSEEQAIAQANQLQTQSALRGNEVVDRVENSRTQAVRPLSPFSTSSKTYHGLAIIFSHPTAGPVAIGRISNWAPQMYARDGTHIYELGATSYGRPVDYVPGPARNFTIEATRTELWLGETELYAGFDIFTDLVSQREPFQINEALFFGGAPYRVWIYKNCWFSAKNEQAFDAEGDAKVISDITINFVSRIRAYG